MKKKVISAENKEKQKLSWRCTSVSFLQDLTQRHNKRLKLNSANTFYSVKPQICYKSTAIIGCKLMIPKEDKEMQLV